MSEFVDDGHGIILYDVYDDDGDRRRDYMCFCPYWDEPGHECQFFCFCWQEDHNFLFDEQAAEELAKPNCEYCAGTGRMKGTCVVHEWWGNDDPQASWWVDGSSDCTRREGWLDLPSGQHEILWYYYAYGPDIYGECDADLEWKFKNLSTPASANLEIHE